jgi:hypothetical protein
MCRREPEQGLRDGTAAGSAALMLASSSARAAGSPAGGGGRPESRGETAGPVGQWRWGAPERAAGGRTSDRGRREDNRPRAQLTRWRQTHPWGRTDQLVASPLVGGGLVARGHWSWTASNPKRAAGGSQGRRRGSIYKWRRGVYMSIGMGWDVFARLRYIYLNRCTLDTLRDGPGLEPTWMDGPLAAAGIH